MNKIKKIYNANSIHVKATAQPLVSEAEDVPLKLDDQVIFYDENDKPVNGVVRWIGVNTEVMRNNSKIVGIETVSFDACIIIMFVVCMYIAILSRIRSR